MTDVKIVGKANELARRFYARRGCVVPEGYRFDKATHPHEVEVWDMAVEAFEFLQDTDVESALAEMDE